MSKTNPFSLPFEVVDILTFIHKFDNIWPNHRLTNFKEQIGIVC